MVYVDRFCIVWLLLVLFLLNKIASSRNLLVWNASGVEWCVEIAE